MKKFIIYFVKLMFFAERTTKRVYRHELYLLAFMVLLFITSGIMATAMFLAVRLTPIEPVYARNNLANPGVFLLFAIPISINLFYRKRIDVDLIREQVNDCDEIQLKKERNKGVLMVILSSSLPLIILALFSLLIKFNVI